MNNRKIKFRAWIEPNKKMFYQGTQYLGSFIRRTCRFLCGREHESYLDKDIDKYLMQSTGIKDKNGKEIYEGDLVKIKDNKCNGRREGVVCFRNGSFCIKGEINEDYRWIDYEVEVIGNTFENPS